MAALSVRLLAHNKVQPPRISKFRYSPRRSDVRGEETYMENSLEGHSSYRPRSEQDGFFKRPQKKQQTIVYARCEHGTGALLELHDEHRLFRGALSPHRPLEPCPRILL